jgi:hypothetical protein
MLGPLKPKGLISRNGFITEYDRETMKVRHLGNSNSELPSMFQLPEIPSRKLADLEGGDNPFKVNSQNEKLLVYREKQRDVQKMETAKRKIEMKYLHGTDHLVHLCSNGETERRGLLREIRDIPVNQEGV